LSVSQVVGSAIDSCTLGVEAGGALSISEWDEITIKNAAETETYFGGYVTNIEETPVGPELDLVLTCQDYGIRFERARYNGEWKTSTTLASVLATIKANALPPLAEFDFATYVQSLGSIARLRSPRLTVRDLLDEICSRLNADWYVGYDKKLHIFSEVENFAPYAISDEPNYSTSYPCENLKRYRSGTATVNRVTVVGGAYLSDDVEHEYAGDGQQVRFVVPYRYHEASTNTAVKVYQNAGSDETPSWSLLTLGAKYLDDNVAKDVYLAFEEKFFEFTAAPPNLKRSWKVSGRYEAPLRVVVTNDASYTALGMYLDDVIVDDTIRAKDEARIVGTAYMLEHANTTVLTCATVEPGLRAGQVIRITNGELGLSSSEKMIRNLTMTFPGGGNVRYSLSIGDYVPDLYAILRKLLKRKSIYQYEWREDEVLDVYESWSEELGIAESVTATTAAGPYYFSDVPAESMEFGGVGAFG
jgi:hypothetical protein